MNKQKTLLITFLVHPEDEKSEEDSIVVPREAGAYQGEPLANVEDAQENRGEEKRDADGLTA